MAWESWDLPVVRLCGKLPSAFVLRDRGGPEFSTSGCHSVHMKYCIEVGGEELNLNRSWASCRFWVMYKGGIPASTSKAVGYP